MNASEKQMNESRYRQLPYSAAATELLARKPRLFIDGEWVASTGDSTLAVIDPSNGREIGRIVDASVEDVDRAVTAARRAFDDGRWTRLPPIEREGLMHKLANAIEAHADELAELEAIDNGKPKSMAAVVDIPNAYAMMRYMAGWATKLGGETIEPMSAPPGTVSCLRPARTRRRRGTDRAVEFSAADGSA